MDLLIYEKKSKKAIIIFTDVKIEADEVMICENCEMKFLNPETETVQIAEDGTVEIKRKQKGKILYLEDYKKPY